MKYILLLLVPSLVQASSIENIINRTETKYNLPVGIINAIIKVESSHDHSALNPNDGNKFQKARGLKVKSYGLMQIQLAAAREVKFKGKVSELMRPEVNIEYGARYLNKYYNKYHNLSRALTCYNSGPWSKVCQNGRYTHYVGLILNALYE